MLRTHGTLIIGVLFLAGCSSSSVKSDNAVIRNSVISPIVYDKMVHNEDLSLNDLVALESAGVRETVILHYVRRHHTIYYLCAQDVNRLRSAGMSSELVDYLAATPRQNEDSPILESILPRQLL